MSETFSDRHLLDDDFEVIPTPGHTRGATAFLWDNGRNRMLFTGDTVWLSKGEWVAAVLKSSDREAYVESLELMRGLDFDVLVPWNVTGGAALPAMMNRRMPDTASMQSWSASSTARIADERSVLHHLRNALGNEGSAVRIRASA